MASRCSRLCKALPRRTALPWLSYSRVITHNARGLATASDASSRPAHPLPSLQMTDDPRISQLVDDISGLTLLQAADLVTLLKTRLNIQEAVPAAASAPTAQAAAAESDESTEEKPKEKTVFTLHLESFNATAKPKVIREVKALVPNLTLIDAKKFVESLPKILKENMTKDDAEKLQKTFEAIGAIVKLD